MRRLLVLAFLVSFAVPARAEAPKRQFLLHPTVLHQAPAAIISHVLFLNRCKNGCTVRTGNIDSRTDHSDIGQGTITAFSGTDAQWNDIVTCVKGIMAPFNIQVTDQDPGSADHFEVMVAGAAGELGLPTGVLGIADYLCQSPGQCGSGYIPDALVFDFANDWLQQFNGTTVDICGTAAQEIAHAWTLDHATPTSDPMTYNPYASPLHYQDGAVCGSDCQNGYSPEPFHLPCTNNTTHTCMSTGQATQDEVKMITALFGPANAKAPTVTITSPTNGGSVQSGQPFQINVTCDTSDGVDEIDLSIDGTPKATLTSSPAMFTGPSDLADGSHKITVACQTKLKASATADASFLVGKTCNQDSDCAMGFICYQMACVAGPDAQGGIGSPCKSNTDCESGACASDGTMSTCVIPCDPSNDQCPNGFGCLAAGNGGVCWIGAAKGGGGGGCCDAGSGPTGPIVLGLGLAGLLLTRKRQNSEA